ncbi:MAG: hypothetical protein UY60_C0015G0005 [Parcubacteria group bacterium GW2011_GWB1_50_9]|uniref:DUF4352 domain-containing protein n=2 Tax=Parcubacteria group TaxID=1794811 RepID=A0A0G1WP38_9BACT|nr:MAG: hypothetical protein UY60_C0015G0005 [Parcubacteria group bacterium GW2011_GWB1_50_9]KKW20571.1 MAG: hypothetical protein UY61_C0029G0009 [Candidatus Adlerbacteria bacterium GW2011_GWC1_50_9]KKW33563.1 MAG: hypothetical protein UY78_C0008G0005 [Parcubacteria group bacterium GW2011_GWA1_53_13]
MKYLLSICILLAAVFLVYVMVFNRQEELAKSEEQAGEVKQKQWETKIDEEPPVTIEITPIEFGQAASKWKFNVIFTTHSGSLDFDPMQVASITDDKGGVSQPVAWEGPGPGGHHREGILIFNVPNPAALGVELKIKDVGGVAERLFIWNRE